MMARYCLFLHFYGPVKRRRRRLLKGLHIWFYGKARVRRFRQTLPQPSLKSDIDWHSFSFLFLYFLVFSFPLSFFPFSFCQNCSTLFMNCKHNIWTDTLCAVSDIIVKGQRCVKYIIFNNWAVLNNGMFSMLNISLDLLNKFHFKFIAYFPV